jgi:hypothetical protein
MDDLRRVALRDPPGRQPLILGGVPPNLHYDDGPLNLAADDCAQEYE